MSIKSSSQSGFSVIEIALVIVIGGILLTLFSGALISMTTRDKVETTKQRMAILSEAIKVFADANNRLPCVASRTVAYNDPPASNYGRETSCSGAATAGTVQHPGNPSGTVRIGFVPTRDLNLPDEIGYDAWGSRFMYAVTTALTTPATYDLSQGRIRINDNVGNEITDSITNSKATYLLFSVGPDRRGGYNMMGNVGIACDEIAPRADITNCDDGDGIFVSSALSSHSQSASHFDDFIVYESNFQSTIIPGGALVPFDRTSCPNGWTGNTHPTVQSTQGRIVVGTGQFVESTAPDSDTGSTGSSMVFTQGVAGGWASRLSEQTTPAPIRVDNSPPSASFIYCRKNDVIVSSSSSGSSGGSGSGSTSSSSSSSSTSSSSSSSTSSSSSSSSSSSGGGRVICTHFYRRGRFPRDLWRMDLQFSALNLFPCTVRGYQFWAIPLVQLMRKYPWTEMFVYPWARARAEEIAYQLGQRAKPNYFGKFTRLLIEPFSFVLGIFVPEQNWQKIHGDMPSLLLK